MDGSDGSPEGPGETLVILVRPKFQGNIGAVARAMANFGFRRLVLVGAPELEEQAYKFSKHARDVLVGARRCHTLEEALEDVDLAVASSGIWFFGPEGERPSGA